MYRLDYDRFGKAILKQGTLTIPIADGNRHYAEFLEWNKQQEVPLDLKDREPDPIPRDLEIEAIDGLIAKDDSRQTSAAEKVELVLLAIKRLRRKNVL